MKFNFFFIIKFLIFYFLLYGIVNAQNRYDLPQKVLQGELIISQINDLTLITKVKCWMDISLNWKVIGRD